MDSFDAWLRAKRGLYLPWLAACALVSLLVLLAMHWVDAHFPAIGGWDPLRPHAWPDPPWWLVAWLSALLYVGIAALLAMAFEAILYFLRLDRGDQTWSSMVWSGRGWLAGLAWTMLPLAAIAAISSAVDRELGWLLLLVWAPYWAYALPLAFPIFVLNRPYVSASRPTPLPRPRLPGWLPLACWLVVSIGMPLLGMVVISWFDSPGWPLFAALAPLAVAIAIYLRLSSQLLWLNYRAGLTIGEALRSARLPAFFLPWIGLELRWHALYTMLLLVVAPAWLFLTSLLPLLEDQLLDGDHGLMPLINASRFVVSWWWAIALAGYSAWGFVLSWFQLGADGRLLHQLGAVPGAHPQIRYAGEPSGLRSRK